MTRRLRTKTGCVRCRSRKKKCGEEKPKCHYCAQWNLSCSYDGNVTTPSVVQGSKVPISVEGLLKIHSEESPPTNNELTIFRFGGAGIPKFRDQRQYNLIACCSDTYSRLIIPIIKQEYRDAHPIKALALKTPLARDAIAAFTGISLAIQQPGNKELMSTSFSSYQAALQQLISYLGSGRSHLDYLGLLLTITFLGLFESLGTGSTGQAISHFLAAAKLTPLVSHLNGSAELFLRRIAIECWLYNLSTLAIYSHDCQTIMNSISWSTIAEVFESADNTYLSYQVSPHLGGFHELNYLMIVIASLGRQNDDNKVEKRKQLKKIKDRLIALEAKLNSEQQDLPLEYAGLVYMRIFTTILALRIYLYKVAFPERCSFDHQIQSIVSQAQGNVQDFRSRYQAFLVAMTWPLTIFLLAADSNSSYQFFRRVVEEVCQQVDKGHQERLKNVLEVVRKSRTHLHCVPGQACNGLHDGLSALLTENSELGQFSKGSRQFQEHG